MSGGRSKKGGRAAWEEMGWSETPFSCDGLTVEEIVRMYRESADRGAMVEILAELCATNKERMGAFLEARGYEAVVRKKRHNWRNEAQIAERKKRVEEGRLLVHLTAEEAAQRLGVTVKTAQRYAIEGGYRFARAAYRRKGQG